ncbi:MAG: hypothetical protein H7Y36_08465 [Armatimonadetes bacterium]|nr:hypothetical protein [Akkermansiaceae bacterium]
MLNIANQVSKVLTLLLVSSLLWGGILALLAVWIFGASISIVWTIGFSIFGGLLFCLFVICWAFYQSIDPRELQDDEGTEMMEALLLGSAKC